jgi:hypothetical protein
MARRLEKIIQDKKINMKTGTLILSLFISMCISCKKGENTNPDIIYKKIDKQIIVNKTIFDSVFVLNINDDVANDFFIRVSYTALVKSSDYSLFFASDDSI